MLLKEINVSQSSGTEWKKNDTLPNGKILMKISEKLNISVDYLLFGKEENKFSITNNNNTINGGIQANTYHSESNEPKDKIQEELLKILSELTIEEQIKLMNLVYNFRENLNKKQP